MGPRVFLALGSVLVMPFLSIHPALQMKNPPAGSKVKVIAPSVSTSLMAQTILANLHLSEASLRHADRALVVVRSSLSDPLRFSYDTECELKAEAENQLNIAGPVYHIYIYTLDDELRASEESHRSFPADDH